MSLLITHVQQPRTARLITSANHKPPVLERLAPTFGARSKLEELESVTSGRLAFQQKGVPGIAPAALTNGYGYTYVNAAFAYTRPRGSRFNPPDWGVWYAAFEPETALQEVSFHLTRALGATGEYENTTSYVALYADFDAEFVDLRDLNPAPECLHSDCSIGYPAGQRLAAEVREAGANGIVYPSVRASGGTCLAVFWPGLIQNFQKGETYTLRWEGEPTPVITRVE